LKKTPWGRQGRENIQVILLYSSAESLTKISYLITKKNLGNIT
jgi:hypothetical protein